MAAPVKQVTDIKPIKGFNSFSIVFKSGKKFYDSELIGVFIYSGDLRENTLINKCTDKFTFYYGVTVGKKFVKKAVVRNRIKRLLRVSIRKIYKERYEQNQLPPFRYVVFSWRNAPKMQSLINLSDVFPSVEKIFDSAEKYLQVQEAAVK